MSITAGAAYNNFACLRMAHAYAKRVMRMSGDAGRFFIAVVGKHHAVPGKFHPPKSFPLPKCSFGLKPGMKQNNRSLGRLVV